MKTMSLAGQIVPRIGYGTMRLPGPNVMGPPKDHGLAIKVLKRTIEMGVKVIDTAWYYGPDISNELLAEALYPYPDDLIIITKLGGARDNEGGWIPFIKPDELKIGMDRDLKLLKLQSIPIVHLRWMENQPPEAFEVALDAMLEMKKAGKFKHLGLSSVSMDQLDLALAKTEIVTVSNQYSIDDRHDDPMLKRCEQQGIAYLPYFPLAVGKSDEQTILQKWASQLSVSTSQVALAWLLRHSPVMLPIPGTSSLEHLEENFSAGSLDLTDEAYEDIKNNIV
jgi:pyridoxine 4-dehydrogenase